MSSGTPRLSKSRFVAGLQCRKRLWLEVHRRDLAEEPGPATQRIFDSGHEVGELAQREFPGGVLIDTPHYEVERAICETEEAVAAGATILFEPAFMYDNILVRVDVLKKNDDGTWDLIEVKSTTKASDTHVADAAVQKYVLEGSGFTVRSVSIMHLNRECRYPDLSNLFIIESVDDRVREMWPELQPRVGEFSHLLLHDSAPDVPIGKHCTAPYSCPFINHCWAAVKHPSIFTIPRINKKSIDTLIGQGVTGIVDVPDTFPLSENQRRYVDLFKEGHTQIMWPAIRDAFAELEYPLYFLDFETQADPIPRHDGLRPYDQFPFQYSLHILHQDGTLEHTEYLHPNTTDPRRPLMESLIRNTGETGSIVAYNAPFEQRVIKDLARIFPEHRRRLHRFLPRFWDLLVIFRSYYVDPAFGGSNSIKKVLPVLVPELSYAALEVQSGDIAQLAWKEMIGTSDEAKRAELERSLKEYCKLDTLAMVELYRVLEENIPA
ncbi:MAG: DUF2779 domain-containing protein [Spirochaeta sp.]|jgi:hypothetical protein|nr:DUF2779 domain-containing protein [Spirochaeta sp.]